MGGRLADTDKPRGRYPSLWICRVCGDFIWPLSGPSGSAARSDRGIALRIGLVRSIPDLFKIEADQLVLNYSSRNVCLWQVLFSTDLGVTSGTVGWRGAQAVRAADNARLDANKHFAAADLDGVVA